jgi:hypothetical protein
MKTGAETSSRRQVYPNTARLFAGIPAPQKYIPHVNHRPAANVKPLLPMFFACAARAAIE